ncbi:MAG: ABC transporter transmembrane domain-containing protein, partial [Candidatus Nanohaloarchaea archaeon]|nr:ABC transporter transmembrane domain-containing protein [Candidatus Nanohaloarchaea archaeon]
MQDSYHAADEVFKGQREHVDRPMQRLFRDYAQQNWFPLATGILSSLFAHLLFLVPPYILGVAIDSIFLQNKAFTLPLLPAAWIPAGREAQFWFTVALILGSSLLGAVFTWSKGWGLNRFAQLTQHQVRTDTYDAMQRLDMGFFQDKQTGELMSILSNDVNRLEQFLNGGFNVLTRMLVTVGGIAVVLFYLNWQLALITLVMVPVIAVMTHRFVQTIQPIYSEVRSTVGRLNSRIETNLGGIQVIKASTTEDQESNAIEDVSQEYFDTNWDAISTRITFFPALRLTSGIGFVITFLVGGYWVLTGQAPWLLHGSLTVGEFVTFILLSQRFIWPMAQFGELVNMYQRAHASSERIFGLMNQPPRIQEREDASPLELETGVVEYSHVSFGYGDETVIDDISFQIDGGEMLALVGP